MNRFEKNISYLLNNLAIKNKIIFYFFRVFTYTGEWWMYILYAVITILIDFNKGIDAIKIALIAYGLHYPIYFLIKNTTKMRYEWLFFVKNGTNLKSGAYKNTVFEFLNCFCM